MVSWSIVQNIIVRGLNYKFYTIVKISWLRYFSSVGEFMLSFRRSHARRLPLFGKPLPAVNSKSSTICIALTSSLCPFSTHSTFKVLKSHIVTTLSQAEIINWRSGWIITDLTKEGTEDPEISDTSRLVYKSQILIFLVAVEINKF